MKSALQNYPRPVVAGLSQPQSPPEGGHYDTLILQRAVSSVVKIECFSENRTRRPA
jgi:hypothetical protein